MAQPPTDADDTTQTAAPAWPATPGDGAPHPWLSEPVAMRTGPDDYPFDLGHFTRHVTCADPAAQTWFDRGLVWAYAFNHEEAYGCFLRAIDADPTCAMAHWGAAYVLGPNYNKGWADYDPVDLATSIRLARGHADRARACVANPAVQATEVEAAFVATLSARYPDGEVPDLQTEGAFDTWTHGYAEATRLLYQHFPDDLDALTLHADALIGLTPWQLWDLTSGGPTGPHTLEARGMLEQALRGEAAQRHPGLLHLYIHLMEM